MLLLGNRGRSSRQIEEGYTRGPRKNESRKILVHQSEDTWSEEFVTELNRSEFVTEVNRSDCSFDGKGGTHVVEVVNDCFMDTLAFTTGTALQ